MQPTFPVFQPESPQAEAILNLFLAVLGISAVIFLVVTGLIVVVLVRFRERRTLPEQDFGSHKAEILWMVGPVIIVVWIFAISAKLVLTLNAVPKADPPGDTVYDLEVIGHQWWWEIRYPGTDIVGANEVHIPVGQRLRVKLTSADVIHCFWVPQLARKMDVIPGWDNYVWLQASRAGEFQGRCAEYCGNQHAWMNFKVYAHPQAEYQAWLAAHQATPAPPAEESLAAQGKELFTTLTCPQCHTVSGTIAQADAAPNLTHVASRKELGGGVIRNSRENLRLWLKNPQALKPGCKMPDFKFSDSHLEQIVAYLETLK